MDSLKARSQARLNPAFRSSFRESIWDVTPEMDGKNPRGSQHRLETFDSLESLATAEERNCKGGEEIDSESVQLDEDHVRKGWLAECFACFGKEASCEHESDIWKMLCCKGRVLHPNSHSLLRWNIILMSLYLYTASVTPTEVAFVESNDTPLVLIFLNFLVDMGYMFDILLTMNTGYFLRSVELEMSLNKIRLRYLSSWFTFDLVTGFPFQMMRMVFDANYPAVIGKTLKMLRLMKMLRVLAMSHVMKKLEARNDINFSYLRLFKLAISSLFIMHWLACGFYLLGQSEIDDDCPNTGGCPWTSFYELDVHDFNTQYSTALYWAIMTFCTIGYGDIVPQTNLERWYVNFSMFIGVGFYSYMIGAVLGVMADFSEESTKYKGLMDELNRFMRDTGMPVDLRARLREFFRLKSSMQSISGDMPLLTLLSPVLRDEVTTVLLSNTIMNTPLFRNVESLSNKKGQQTFSTQLAKAVVEEMFGPLEDVCLRGQEGHEASKMYFIRHGVVCTRGTVVTHGGFFGDDMLYSKSFRRYRARTLTFTVTHSVTYSQMMMVLDQFVNEGKVVRFRLFKMLMRERLKNLTKHVRTSRSNTSNHLADNHQRQKRSLWDHIFLTYDEKAQINSVVKSLDTWRAGELIGSYMCNWMRRRGLQERIEKDKAVEHNLLQQISKVQRRIGDVASKSAPTSTLARPGVRYNTVDAHHAPTPSSSGREDDKREEDRWLEGEDKKTQRENFRFRGIQGDKEIEITHRLTDSPHRQTENTSTAGNRQEHTDESETTPLHKEMFAMNFLVLKKIEELNEKIDRNQTEMWISSKNVVQQIAAVAEMLDRKAPGRAIG